MRKTSGCYRLGLATILVALGGAGGRAQDITVVKQGGEKAGILVSGLKPVGGPAAVTFRKVLDTDLARSGWFRVLRSGRAPIFLEGSCRESRGRLSLNCRLTVSPEPSKGFRWKDSDTSDRARDLAHRLADKIVEAVKGVPGIASTRIAAIGRSGHGKDLFLFDADGGRMVQLTRQGVTCLSPAWSPDGLAIYYTSYRKGYPDIYRIDLRRMQQGRLVHYPGLNMGADVSPDGRSLALTLSKDGNPELYVMDIGSGRLTRITRTPHASEASPSWSPDGRRLVYVSDASGSPQLYILSRSGGRSRRISFRGSENVAPDWGPDGRIAYTSRRSGRYQVCVTDPAGGETRQLTSDYADHEDPSWAPDGRHLVYTKTRQYHSALMILDTYQVDPEIQLTPARGDWYSPAWSPK